MPNGKMTEPSTLTTRYEPNLTLKDNFCSTRLIFRAAILASISEVAPVHVILPDDQIDAVMLGFRIFMETTCTEKVKEQDQQKERIEKVDVELLLNVTIKMQLKKVID
jgi:hypothetical protein